MSETKKRLGKFISLRDEQWFVWEFTHLRSSSPTYDYLRCVRLIHLMDQFIVPLGIPGQDNPELTWVNVGIALSFILVDGILHNPQMTFSNGNSDFLSCIGPWHRKVHSGGFSAMSDTAFCYG